MTADNSIIGNTLFLSFTNTGAFYHLLDQ